MATLCTSMNMDATSCTAVPAELTMYFIFFQSEMNDWESAYGLTMGCYCFNLYEKVDEAWSMKHVSGLQEVTVQFGSDGKKQSCSYSKD